VVRAADLAGLPAPRGARRGAVVVRQRPGTAKGFIFLNLEDETGLINVIVRPQLFARHRMLLTAEPFLLVAGTLQHEDRVISVRADRLWRLDMQMGAVPPTTSLTRGFPYTGSVTSAGTLSRRVIRTMCPMNCHPTCAGCSWRWRTVGSSR
jgi:hypothetical protein